MPNQLPEVSIAILNFNGRKLIQDTIESALAMGYPDRHLFVVDDGSTDESVEFLRKQFPEVPVVQMGRNTKMLNQVRNAALAFARTDHVLITDNDITFHPDCLVRLVEAARAYEDAAVLVPRVMFRHDPRRIYIDRNEFHYICASIDRNRNRMIDELPESERSGVAPTFGCGIHLLVKSRLERIGSYDGDYPMGWGDDGEFHHRVNLSGMRCYAVRDATIFHEAIKGAPRVYGQLHNRLSMIAQSYATRSLLILAPALLAYETWLFLGLLIAGRASEHLRAIQTIWHERHALRKKRREVQKTRGRPDRELFTIGPIYVPESWRRSWLMRNALRVVDSSLGLYWRMVRPIL